jgi:FlaA1/EpsC-like NDP-sugar epimerase
VGYVKAVTAATVLAILVLLFAYRFSSFSRAVFVIHWILLIGLVSLSRLSFRLVDEGLQKGKRGGRPVLIYGAGVGGQLALKEIESNRSLGLYPVGFLDDNPRLRGRKVRGYEIFGGQDALEKMIRKHGIREVIVTFREDGEERKREIASFCLAMGKEINVKQMRITMD